MKWRAPHHTRHRISS